MYRYYIIVNFGLGPTFSQSLNLQNRCLHLERDVSNRALWFFVVRVNGLIRNVTRSSVADVPRTFQGNSQKFHHNEVMNNSITRGRMHVHNQLRLWLLRLQRALRRQKLQERSTLLWASALVTRMHCWRSLVITSAHQMNLMTIVMEIKQYKVLTNTLDTTKIIYKNYNYCRTGSPR